MEEEPGDTAKTHALTGEDYDLGGCIARMIFNNKDQLFCDGVTALSREERMVVPHSNTCAEYNDNDDRIV